jgi:hypothetical protein
MELGQQFVCVLLQIKWLAADKHYHYK